MATGWVFCPINRVLTATLNLDTGTAVTGYPLVNLNDPVHWNQARITTSSGAARIRCTVGTPADSSDSDYLINCVGLVNHNLDGATLTVVHHSTTTYASGTTVTNTPILMDNAMSNPNLLYKFTEFADTYFWLDITGGPTTASIGQLVFGYCYEFGYPIQGEQYDPIPLHEPMMTSGAYEVPTKLTDPAVTKVVTFRDPNFLGSTVMYDKTITSSAYPSYQSVERAFNNLHMINHGGSTNTGVGAAGGAVPILYHEGDVNGISNAGRPAQYGYCKPRFIKHDLRGTKSTVVMSIRDANPRGTDIKPDDGLTFLSAFSTFASTATGTAVLGFVGPV